MIARIFAVLLGYLLSAFGLALTFSMVAEEIRSSINYKAAAVSWGVMVVVQICVQLVLCFAWILNFRLPQLWGSLSTVLGAASFLGYPLVELIRAPDAQLALAHAMTFISIGALLLAPYGVLMMVLLFFHRGSCHKREVMHN